MPDLLEVAFVPQIISITVPGVPVAKGRPRFRNVKTKAGAQFTTTYTPAKTQSYENLVKMAAAEAMDGKPPMDCPIVLTVWLYMPIPKGWGGKKKMLAITGQIRHTKKPDADNCLKAIKDALNEVVWRSDSQVCTLTVYKLYDETPRAVLRVERAAGVSAP